MECSGRVVCSTSLMSIGAANEDPALGGAGDARREAGVGCITWIALLCRCFVSADEPDVVRGVCEEEPGVGKEKLLLGTPSGLAS
jgi:hypothetical protein